MNEGRTEGELERPPSHYSDSLLPLEAKKVLQQDL